MNKRSSGIVIVLFLSITLTAFGQKNRYKSGYLIFENNRTQSGLIKFSSGSWSIYKSKPARVMFKFSKESKPLKVKDDVIGFVIEEDSFTVKKNIHVNSLAPTYKRDFVEVVEKGEMNLFLHVCTASSGVGVGPISINDIYKTWILCKDGSPCITVTKPKKQEEQIRKFFSGNEAVLKKLNLSNPNYWNFEDLVNTYNSH